MKNTVIIAMILGGALSRLIPHTPNVTAVTAIALLGGAYLSNRTLAVLVPLLALWVSDLFLGFHNLMPFVYVAVALIAVASNFALHSRARWVRVAATAIGSSLFFFAVTNFGVWLMAPMYAKTAAGLVECYVIALPFLGTQMFGDLLFSGLLFGAVWLVKTWKPQLMQSSL